MKTTVDLVCKDRDNHILYFDNNQQLTAIADALLDAVVKSDIAKKHAEFTGKPLALPIELVVTITESND